MQVSLCPVGGLGKLLEKSGSQELGYRLGYGVEGWGGERDVGLAFVFLVKPEVCSRELWVKGQE